MDTQALAAVIIVTWNNDKDIGECLSSVLRQNYANYKVIVVDNASSDNTVRVIKEKFPQVMLLAQDTNLYFAAGNNVGMRYAIDILQAEYVALLNPDTSVSQDWLSKQVNILGQNQQVGVLGAKVVFMEGYGVGDKHTTADQMVINTVGLEQGGYLFPYDRGIGEIDQGQYDQDEQVYAVSGVSMIIRCAALAEVGLFYEPMQMYLEDADLCVRINRAGWHIIYTSSVTVRHKHMQSTNQQSSDFYRILSRRNYLLLVARNYSLKKFFRALWENYKFLGPWQFAKVFVKFVKVALA